MAVLILLVLAGAVSLAQESSGPRQLPYQGVLERNGQLINAIGSDTVSFRVSLWDANSGGTRVWPEADQGTEYEEHSVNVYSGRFAFNIGSEVPYRHVAATDLYLDIQVMGPDDSVFVPLSARQRFRAAPFAVAADRSDTDFSVAGDLQIAGTVTNGLDVTGTTRTDALSVDANAEVAGDLNVTGSIVGPRLMHDSSPDLQSAGITCPTGKKVIWALGWVNDSDHNCDSANRDNRCSNPIFLMGCVGNSSCTYTGNGGGCGNPGPTCLYAMCE